MLVNLVLEEQGLLIGKQDQLKQLTLQQLMVKDIFVIQHGGAFTATLPASPSAGDIVAFADYTRTFGTNNLTIGRNSEPIGGVSENAILSVDGQSATFVYVDGTEGWINVQETQTSQAGKPPFITATGGTITTSGNCKIHTFTGPGTFTVTNLAIAPANNALAYMVVAGGGSGGDGGTGEAGGGGGAGGFREGRNNPITPYTASPLAAACSALTATLTSFPITVGAGGAPGLGGGNPAPSPVGNNGSNSTFSTITSNGGGFGSGGGSASGLAGTGGSGGGGNGEVNPGHSRKWRSSRKHTSS